MKSSSIYTGWRRVIELQKAIAARGLSGGLIHKPENIYYFSNVFPIEPSFLLVPSEGEPELVVAASSYREASQESLIPVTSGELDIANSVYVRLIDRGLLLKEDEAPLKRAWHKIMGRYLGVEDDYFKVNLYNYFGLSHCESISSEIFQLRNIKDQSEIEFLREASRIADEAMMETAQLIKPGMTEREVSGLMDRFTKAKGADESKARVRSGANSAKAFTRWMGGEILEGPLLIDYGARIKGYWSDIARTFWVGKKPTELFAEIYNIVLDSSNKALAQMVPGNSIYIVEETVRKIFANKGYEEKMIYTAGHAIGLEIHEDPILSLPSQTKEREPKFASDSPAARKYDAFMRNVGEDKGPLFEKGQVFALEPGIYMEDMGIRIEDMVLIEEKPEYMSTFPRKLDDIIII